MTLAVQSCSQLSISLAFHPHLEKKKIEMKSPEGSQESCVTWFLIVYTYF